MKIRNWLFLGLLFVTCNGCKVYSLSGAATSARTMTVDQFFNNTDLAPANLGAVFTNRLKDYYQQNSSLRIIPSNGELRTEGSISEYRINPMAPVSTGDPNATNTAALSRLTIAVKVTFDDTLDPKNSFKDKSL